MKRLALKLLVVGALIGALLIPMVANAGPVRVTFGQKCSQDECFICVREIYVNGDRVYYDRFCH